ncbi:MAG: ATP-binding protein [Acidobacteria bacterium]|nr:ATP-binding protein [Acidobacteriota bacterium]
MALAEGVNVARRYQRAISIDSDMSDPTALEGFICPRSSAEVLETMAHHVLATGQGAFTWTGPYGTGKSSLAVVLGAALNGTKRLRVEAESLLGKPTFDTLAKALPPRTRGWRVLPVAGRRDRPAQVLGEAIEAAEWFGKRVSESWTEPRVLEVLEEIAARNPRAGGGLCVFIDEMGKFLEAAAHEGSDIHLFQQLAERASRSRGRLIVVGILHQAFQEYAHRLSRETRDEWAKIQGRYVDLPINTAGDEQIELLGRAIENGRQLCPPSDLARGVAALSHQRASGNLAERLEDCWPLHPIVACLLGPLSRRRFGQNQRSLFAFLNSGEPLGFQEFLRAADEDDLYTPDRLWDYLSANLEPSILVSPDGHRWALASYALGRCEALGGDELELRLLKVIGLLDLLKESSGLAPSTELLGLALGHDDDAGITAALEQLRDRSLIVFRKFSGAWAIFEGSDFDIDQALEGQAQNDGEPDLAVLDTLTELHHVVAKRHYHRTGALRWLDVGVVPLAEIEQAAADFSPRQGAIGTFLLGVPTFAESEQEARVYCRNAAQVQGDWDVVAGFSPSAWGIPALAAELTALQRVRDETPELQGDRVARTEVLARIAAVQERVEAELARAFDNASWYRNQARAIQLSRAGLSTLASELADARFSNAPRLNNELLGRMKPSSNAVAAQNALLRRMVLHEGQSRLGIEGFPAEGGLFVSLLLATGLYCRSSDGWRFVAPQSDLLDTHNLAPAWKAARDFLESNSGRAVPVSELHELWRQPPLGIKDGLLPVLSVAFFLSQQSVLAFYREGVFQTRITDLDTDFLVRDPADVQFRWMDLTRVSRRLLAELAGVVRELDTNNALDDLEPIDVARGLVTIHDRLPAWTGRTQRLSRIARDVRHLFRQAKDPNRLIFDDIPELLREPLANKDEDAATRIASQVRQGLTELTQAWPAMLGRLREVLLAELQVPNASPAMLAELRARAENIRELGGDHRLEAFIVRLSRFEGTDADIEGLAGLAINKPPQTWVDPDIDGATVELASMAQRFLRAETFARVKGRSDKRHSMAVMVGLDGAPATLHQEFTVGELDRPEITSLVSNLEAVLAENGEKERHVVLAALAELSSRYLAPDNASPIEDEDEERAAS